MKLILASASPRRREILSSLGVPFITKVVDTDETCDLTDAGARVEAISKKKCLAVLDAVRQDAELWDEDCLILASDTLVTLDGVFLGKPADAEDARRMVGMLQGRTHTVASGIALWSRPQVIQRVRVTLSLASLVSYWYSSMKETMKRLTP